MKTAKQSIARPLKRAALPLLLCAALALALCPAAADEPVGWPGMWEGFASDRTPDHEHQWAEATGYAPETCTVCGETRGERLPYPLPETGDEIVFGTYPQTAAGTDSTPIVWIVLNRNNRSLEIEMISKYGLDCMPRNTSGGYVRWDGCTLRTWLNGRFLDRAFTADEREAIAKTYLSTDSGMIVEQFYGPVVIPVNTDIRTEDHLYVPQYRDVVRYFGDESGHGGVLAPGVLPTDYAVSRGAVLQTLWTTERNEPAAWWLLRENGVYGSTAAWLGRSRAEGEDPNGFAVRPVVRVKLASPLFRHDPDRFPCDTSHVMTDAVCAGCGCALRLPFRPADGRILYCADCAADMGAGAP